MKLIGFEFRKINAERINNSLKDLKIGTNIDIKELNNIKPKSYKGKEEILEVVFNYIVDYSPSIAKIELTGKIILSLEPKLIKDVLNEWKDKKMPMEFKIALFNTILTKSGVKALSIEDELKLPYHIPFPKLTNKKE